MLAKVLSVWCDRAWLWVVYALGLGALVMLVANWGSFTAPEKIAWVLAVGIPLHAFEENTFPGGFFYMNNLTFGSREPLVYPQNRATNMVTNLGAEVVFILIALNASTLGAVAVTVAAFFGVVELVNHTREGVAMFKRFRECGKRSIYAPGEATSVFPLFPNAVWGVVWLVENAATGAQVLAGVGICVGVAVCLILLPFAINMRAKSAEFAFRDTGYFKRFLT